MHLLKLHLTALTIFILGSLVIAQDEVVRDVIDVPKADSGSITIDGVMEPGEWDGAVEANLVTSTGFGGWFNYYYDLGEAFTEPDYDELFGRIKWTDDTLYLFIHLDEIVTDTTDLYFAGQWGGDQMMVGLSSRLGMEEMLNEEGTGGAYNGWPFAAPEGPYHFWVVGDEVSLNGGNPTSVLPQFMGCPEDTLERVFNASDNARWSAVSDPVSGAWDVEMAIYHPDIKAQSQIAFNFGGTNAQSFRNLNTEEEPDYSYAYWCWYPHVTDEPFTNPTGANDPGFYILINTEYWPLLNFLPGTDDQITREVIDVPRTLPAEMNIDGVMNESAWDNAAKADLVTSTGFDGWFNYYYDLGEAFTEPDYDELYGRLLWADDTLYLFIHLDEIVTDTTDLYFAGQWGGDQMMVGLSSRLGMEEMLNEEGTGGAYNGWPFAAPDGPYHYWAVGDEISLNGGNPVSIPLPFMDCPSDTVETVFNASDYARWASVSDPVSGAWDVEMAIYHPDIKAQSQIAFNFGGTNAQSFRNLNTEEEPDYSYAYWCWYPHVTDEPFTNPTGANDPGYYILINTEYWPLLNFQTELSGIKVNPLSNAIPESFGLLQNYPNPFNPSTNINFNITRQTPVTLKIYNVVGQLVATLINGQAFNAGKYSVQWDASNLASGIYVYRLEAEGRASSLKMMLLK